MAAIARSLIERGSAVFYTTVAALVEKRDLRLARELKRLNPFECLALDDIGYVQPSHSLTHPRMP
jgi:DNA replication protein DnaC